MASLVRKLLTIVSGIIWVYSYMTLGAMMAVAALPGWLLARWGWRLDVTVGPEWLSGALDAVVGLYFSILAFFVFGIVLMFVLPAVRFAFAWWKPHVGEIPIHSFRIWPWYNVNGMQFMFNTVFGRFARPTTLYPVFLRMMGAKIGKRVVFNTQHVYDLDLLKVGDDVVIGANASILGHVGEKGKLVRAGVTIGNKCTVGQYANLFPGVTLGDNCHVGAMSMVPKGATLDSNAIYAGIPVKKIRDLAPGEKVTSDDVSATTGGKP
ncbi:MAG: DapH/DapD/GlmU-related protein [Thermoplasmatota archaeon]